MNRFFSLDTFKLVACFLVIFIHIPIGGDLGGIIMPLSRIAVPFFFMVSGFFIWDRNKNKLISKINVQIKKIFRLVIVSNMIYLIWGILKLILKQGDLLSYFKNLFSIKKVIALLIFNESPLSGHLWYVLALLYVLIIYKYSIKFKYTKLIKNSIIILLLIDLAFGKYSLLIFGREFSYILVRNFLFVGVPYFLIGNIIRECYEKKELVRFENKELIGFSILFVVTSIIEKESLLEFSLNATRDHYISTTPLVICIFILAINNKGAFKESILPKLGEKYSLYIYIYISSYNNRYFYNYY